MDYNLIIRQMEALAEESSDYIPVMANVAALLFHSMSHINWAGFYLVKDDVLILGPFQGKVACVKIEKGRGVWDGLSTRPFMKQLSMWMIRWSRRVSL